MKMFMLTVDKVECTEPRARAGKITKGRGGYHHQPLRIHRNGKRRRLVGAREVRRDQHAALDVSGDYELSAAGQICNRAGRHAPPVATQDRPGARHRLGSPEERRRCRSAVALLSINHSVITA
jgi:hypothetical protein